MNTKKVAIIAIIIITSVISYYFLWFLPSQKRFQNTFSRQTECMRICQPQYEKYKNDTMESQSTSFNVSVFDPQYAYNAKENTCFYSRGSLSFNNNDTTSTVIMQDIVNCQTNNEVLHLIEVGNKVIGCENCASNKLEYTEKSSKYMGGI